MAALMSFLIICGSTAHLAVASRARGAGAGGRHFLKGSSDLQPELVADLLIKVEDEWKSQAASFVACNATAGEDCAVPAQAFGRSCSTVVAAVIKGSSGDRKMVTEYMDDICGEDRLQGWKRQHCEGLKQALMEFMSADDYDNREHLDATRLCSGLWQSFSKEEAEEHRLELERQEKARQEAAKRAAEQAEAERKLKEEEAKLAAEEAKKRAEEEAKRQAEEAKRKAEEERLKAEELRRKEEEEAARQAAEAKRQAEEAAARVKAKQEEAAKEAELARVKMEEAQAAVRRIHKHEGQVKEGNASNFTLPTAALPSNASNASQPAASSSAGNASKLAH